MLRVVFCLSVLASLTASVWADESPRPIDSARVREAARKALALVQESQAAWRSVETCVSCHHQMVPEVALRLARGREVPHDDTAARDARAEAFSWLSDIDAAVQGYNSFDSLSDGWAMFAAGAADIRPSLSTTAWALSLAWRQRADGSWHSLDVRPPQSHGRITATAVTAAAVRRYLPEKCDALRKSCLERARDWLAKVAPRSTEDHVFRLWGLHWTDADGKDVAAAARALAVLQRDDGGWSQLPSGSSDAYATGTALAALMESGQLRADSMPCQRGLHYLLNSQQTDGSWHVRSRLHPPAPVSPDYFDSGFPYEHDQFVSIMGTCWAAAALMHALPSATDTAPASQVGGASATEGETWTRLALFADAAELKAHLDEGMDPNSKTSERTTALMMAARDLNKVRLLVERGADVNARSQAGFTPLLVAARYPGNVEVVRWLLQHGADHAAKGGRATHPVQDATALYVAAASGDVQIVRALLDAGANREAHTILFGKYKWTPAFPAANGGDADVVSALLRGDANSDQVDQPGVSLLGWAAIGNHASVARVLLDAGAKPNNVDRIGMNPLLYAASVDFGDTEVVDVLLKAGADSTRANPQGETAAALAAKYGHTAILKAVRAAKGPANSLDR